MGVALMATQGENSPKRTFAPCNSESGPRFGADEIIRRRGRAEGADAVRENRLSIERETRAPGSQSGLGFAGGWAAIHHGCDHEPRGWVALRVWVAG